MYKDKLAHLKDTGAPWNRLWEPHSELDRPQNAPTFHIHIEPTNRFYKMELFQID